MYKNLNPEQWSEQLTSDDNAVILDVRTIAEYEEGHLPNAINVPNIKAEIDKLDKSKHYYVHCRVGGRSAIAAHLMHSKGFMNVYNLNGELDALKIPLEK